MRRGARPSGAFFSTAVSPATRWSAGSDHGDFEPGPPRSRNVPTVMRGSRPASPSVSPVVATSGLTEGSGWVKVNPRTLETKFPGVYAIGDINEIPLANKMPMPKAGVFAEAEGEIVAHQIADAFAGKSSHASFDGFGYCFLEVGGGMAQLVQGNFLAEPAPEVTLTEPSTDYLEHKREFEQERLQKWFGG